MRKLMKARRIYLGLTQCRVANLAGLTRGNYAHIERGRHEPSLEQMEAISKALQMENADINFFKNFCDDLYQKSVDDHTKTA